MKKMNGCIADVLRSTRWSTTNQQRYFMHEYFPSTCFNERE